MAYARRASTVPMPKSAGDTSPRAAVVMVTSIGDADLQPLAGLKRLRRLYLERTSATAAGIAALRQQLPRAEISPEP